MMGHDRMNHEINADYVFLVVADSLRHDTANSEMSCLKKLGADGIVVENCYAPGAGTPSSMPGIMQSRLPIEHGGYGLKLPPSPPTIAEWVSEDGVTTAGYHSNSYTTAGAGFDRGFESFEDLGGFGNSVPDSEEEDDPTSGWRERAREVTDSLGVRKVAEQAIEPLKRRGLMESDPRADGSALFSGVRSWMEGTEPDRGFGWLQLMDTHLPYLPPEEFRPDHLRSFKCVYDLWQALISRPDDLTGEEIDALHELYKGEARYVDTLLSRFTTYLKKAGKWESTALVITADHGELFADRPVPGDAPVKHPNYLCEENTHVPLVISGGAVPSSQNVQGLASGVDIGPTIAAMFGKEPSTEWRGEVIGSKDFEARETVTSAVSHTRGNGVTVEKGALHVAVRSAEQTVLWWCDETPTEYYDRSSQGEDRISGSPGEKFEALESLATETSELVDDVSDRGDVGGSVSKRLRELGYVDDVAGVDLP